MDVGYGYSGTHVRGRTRGRQKRGSRPGRTALLVLVAVAAIVIARKAGLSLPTRHNTVPKDNLETDFGIELSALPSMERYGRGGGSADPADADKLRALADKTPKYADKLDFIADNIGDFSNNGVKNVLMSPEVCDFVLRAAYGPRENSAAKTLDVKKGTIPYLLQYDSRWAFTQYGSSYMGYTACGPTCLSMVAAGLTGSAAYTPDYVAAFAVKNGYYVEGTGTSWSLFTEGAAKLGLRGETISTSEDEMEQALRDGGVMIASMSQGDFTNAGHFIVICKSGTDGFRVYDPSCVARSEKAWSYRQLSGQIAQLWSFTAA